MMANLVRKHSGLIISRALFNYNKSFKNSSLNQNLIKSRQFHLNLNLQKIVSFNLSDIGEGIRDVVVKEWFVKEGDVVKQFDEICEVQSDKATVTITSRYDGKITKLHHKVEDVALVGKPLADFEIEDEENDESSSSSSSSSSEEEDEELKAEQIAEIVNNRRALATPAVRRIAMENQVNLNNVIATGKLGRVLKGDVLEHLNMIPAGTVKPHPTLLKTEVKSSPPVPLAADRVEQLKGVRKAMFKSMSESLKIPHFGYCDEIDLTKLVNTRNDIKHEAINRGIRVSFMPFFIKAASIALHKYPILNSSVDEINESIIYKKAHNISIAMDTAQGLVVPNVKNCQNKSIYEIAQDLNILQEKGLKGQLRPEDFFGGTFSLSNIGIVGGTYTNPVIMSPQVAIGAIGRTNVVPRFTPNGDVFAAHIVNISWSADHRVIDGVTMAKYSNLWKKYLENPNLFLLDGH